MAVSHGEPSTILVINPIRGVKGKIVGTPMGEAWKDSQRREFGSRVLQVIEEDFLEKSAG